MSPLEYSNFIIEKIYKYGLWDGSPFLDRTDESAYDSKNLLKLVYPKQAIIPTYRGLSFTKEKLTMFTRENRKAVENFDLLYDEVILREQGKDGLFVKLDQKDWSSHSLNACVSAITFTGLINLWRKPAFGLFMVFETSRKDIIGFGSDGESGFQEESEIYVKNHKSKSPEKVFVLIKKIYEDTLISNSDRSFVKTSKNDLNYYSLDKYYRLKQSGLILHKDCDIDLVHSDWSEIILQRLSSQYSWLTLID